MKATANFRTGIYRTAALGFLVAELGSLAAAVLSRWYSPLKGFMPLLFLLILASGILSCSAGMAWQRNAEEKPRWYVSAVLFLALLGILFSLVVPAL